jgi:hypothetical protein
VLYNVLSARAKTIADRAIGYTTTNQYNLLCLYHLLIIYVCTITDEFSTVEQHTTEPIDELLSTVQPVSIDFTAVKQTLLKAHQLYLEVRGFTTDETDVATTAAADNADQTDDTMKALAAALYSRHSEHYDVAQQISTRIYSTYSTWYNLSWLLRDSLDVSISSMYSAYLRTSKHAEKWQQVIEATTKLLLSLEQDSSIGDSCEQMCYRIVRKLTKATNMVNDVAPSEAVASQLTEYIHSHRATTAMQTVNQVSLMYSSICDDLQELIVHVGTDSVHYATVVELAASANSIRDWKVDTSTYKIIDSVNDKVSQHVRVSQDLSRGLKRVYSDDHKCTHLCRSIMQQIKTTSKLLAIVAIQQVSYHCVSKSYLTFPAFRCSYCCIVLCMCT